MENKYEKENQVTLVNPDIAKPTVIGAPKLGSTPPPDSVFNHLIMGRHSEVTPVTLYTIPPNSVSNYLMGSSELLHKSEINRLEAQILDIAQKAKDEAKEKNAAIVKLKKLKEELEAKEKVSHVISRVCAEARNEILTKKDFQEKFQNNTNCDCVVVSIDIRSSTELMLRARTPELFSQFITKLSDSLAEIILSNYGVFDKFTGDGILAFFPKFFSGETAILRAIKAAEECHLAFKTHYDKCRGHFNVFIRNTGLGIGIDYGSVMLVNNVRELTVVGVPVVYACRMSNAKAGDTLLNQPAKEELEKYFHDDMKFIETEINIKHEGEALAYKVEVFKDLSQIPKPDWVNQSAENDK